jgi:hypothetical protein
LIYFILYYSLYFSLKIFWTTYIVWKAPFLIVAEQEIPGKTAGNEEEGEPPSV